MVHIRRSTVRPSRKGLLLFVAMLISVLLSSVAFALPTHAERSADHELRYEPGDTPSDSLDRDTVPPDLLTPVERPELVSIPATEAAQPRSTRPNRIISAIDPEELAERLDADRLLLSEIRKPVPEDRAEAEIYLDRLKRLAGLSDPVRLVPLANRVLDQAPIYFDWVDRDFESQDEQVLDYYVGGARGFSFALDNFRTAVLFTIMNRLDLASRVISELESDE